MFKNLFTEKIMVNFYLLGGRAGSGESVKLDSKKTSLIPREEETVILTGKAYIVKRVVWLDKCVEIYCVSKAGASI